MKNHGLRQWEGWHPYMKWKIKHVPNHQPVSDHGQPYLRYIPRSKQARLWHILQGFFCQQLRHKKKFIQKFTSPSTVHLSYDVSSQTQLLFLAASRFPEGVMQHDFKTSHLSNSLGPCSTLTSQFGSQRFPDVYLTGKQEVYQKIEHQ